ncbi:MAG: tetratricopeptide repeat protein, partial [Polyangia bacterium]|nr:tetratricopeptide repeat protein [Polyangia bacterium]
MSILLLVCVGAGVLVLGVLLGRYYVPDTRPLRRAAKEGAMYIRGLNHVLARNNDAAIAELTRAVSENTGTVETYFALGVLFRERGEHERAVRVHQSILVRADVNRRLRLEARFQLGLDFEAAGFLRRARKAFEEVLENSPKHVGAAEKLLSLHEADGDWERAWKALRRLEKVTKKRDEVHASHLLAEMGLVAMEAGELGLAKKHLRHAIGAHPEGLHPRHARALWLRRAGKTRAAAELWLECLGAAPDLAAYFLPHLESAFEELGDLDGLARRLDTLSAERPESAQLGLARARFVGRRDPARALELLRQVIANA